MEVKLNQALKEKNRLGVEISRLKQRMGEQNSRPVGQAFDYVTPELLVELRAKVDQLVRLKAAIGRANGETYERVFRLAELRGLISVLSGLPTKHGRYLESGGLGEPKEVEYQAQMRQAEIDKTITGMQVELGELQDALDRFNATCELEIELN